MKAYDLFARVRGVEHIEFAGGGYVTRATSHREAQAGGEDRVHHVVTGTQGIAPGALKRQIPDVGARQPCTHPYRPKAYLPGEAIPRLRCEVVRAAAGRKVARVGNR